MRTTYVVVPAGIDDPAQPSGGNIYDRRICRGVAELGWAVMERGVPGNWPDAGPVATAALSTAISAIPDGSIVLVDGLIASVTAPVLVPAARRVRLVILIHLPFGVDGDPDADECRVLIAAAAIIATSRWTADLLQRMYPLPPNQVRVAEPGVDPAAPVIGTPAGRELLCVGAVAPHKGQDLLIDALAMVTNLDWSCALVGALDRDPGFVARLRADALAAGIDGRVRFTGPLTGADLEAAYAGADLLVVASRAETYGMVITEALAHGIPVIATDVGGMPAALGTAADGRLPGLLVPLADVAGFAAAVRRWLTDSRLRHDLRSAAVQRRDSLTDWSVTSAAIARVLEAVSE